MNVFGFSDRGRDVLDAAYINRLPQPIFGLHLNGGEWPIYDFEVETGLLRIDVCGLLEVKNISDFISFCDIDGTIHPAEGFFLDALPEERIAISKTKGVAL